jgi:hypothetical protein
MVIRHSTGREWATYKILQIFLSRLFVIPPEVASLLEVTMPWPASRTLLQPLFAHRSLTQLHQLGPQRVHQD